MPKDILTPPPPLPTPATTSSPPLRPPPPTPRTQIHHEMHATEAASYEQDHVHDVYEAIAQHFSSTRYKPWPIVDKFLKEDISPGSIGLDVGCGNGRYLNANQNVFIVGSDRSPTLVEIAGAHHRDGPNTTIVADALNLPHPPETFDFAISIAVIHHLATAARRVEAINAILNLLKSGTDNNNGHNRDDSAGGGGKLLLYVWALEQKSSRRGWDKGDPQDIMVPWMLKQGSQNGSTTSDVEEAGAKTFQRYYHLYRARELEDEIKAAGGIVMQSGYEKDNWWAICHPVPRTHNR